MSIVQSYFLATTASRIYTHARQTHETLLLALRTDGGRGGAGEGEGRGWLPDMLELWCSASQVQA